MDVGARETQWQFIEGLGDADETERLARLALAELQTSPNFPERACEAWRVLAAAEVVGFLESELKDHHLDAAWASHIYPAISEALSYVSVGRGFYFAWLAVRDIASAYLRFPHARDRLPYTLRSAFESKIKKAETERWSVKEFARHARQPETMLAAVYSKVITQLGERYLLVPPSPNHLI